MKLVLCSFKVANYTSYNEYEYLITFVILLDPLSLFWRVRDGLADRLVSGNHDCWLLRFLACYLGNI